MAESHAPADPRPRLSLLDGATPAASSLRAEHEDLARRAADAGSPLPQRLAALDEIAGSEVGGTGLLRARNLERETGLREIYLKFEGDNPTGTQKDRIAFAQVHDALGRGFEGLTVASCGNYGAAVGLACSLAGLRCLVYIPESFRPRRLAEIEGFGAEVVRTPGTYEEAVVLSRDRAREEGLYDANPGGVNTDLQLQAYAAIAREIVEDLHEAPAVVAVPVSNGTTLAGIHRGFLDLAQGGGASGVPRMVAGSSHRKNPIVRSYRRGEESCRDLDPDSIRETPVNEPLINWHSSEGDPALQAVRSSGGWAGDASDREMRFYASTLRRIQGLDVLPASTASLVVLLKHHRAEPLPRDRYVAVLTGRKG